MDAENYRNTDGYRFYTAGSTTCPHPDLCDMRADESYEDYVARHSTDHLLPFFADADEAERNLGVNCFFAFDKYIWKNPTLTPYPHWEIHEFIANWEWNEEDLEQRVPHAQRKFALPPADARRPPEARRFKQAELPRENMKTSIGARAYPVFRQLREHFVLGRDSYRVVIRSATSTNSVDSLNIIERMASGSRAIKRLYGVWIAKCPECQETVQVQEKPLECPTCQLPYGKKTKWRRIGLVNDARGSGATGDKQLSFRWLTDADDVDAVAPYHFKAAGLETETTGWRPDLYVWDDPQTEKNSNTPEKRAKIFEKFDGSVRELEFSGQLLVFNTRKFVDDFAGQISKEPLVSLFFSMHRKARWPTTAPDAMPFVLRGYRYYFPVKGNGERALDEAALDDLERQMVERKYSAEYLNEPIDPKRALFKREHFQILDLSKPDDLRRVPDEVLFGLNREVSPNEQRSLESRGLKICAYNAVDPSGKAEQSMRGDESAIVGLRVSVYGDIYITYIAGGQWDGAAMWNEVYKSARHNRPIEINYEMGVDELHARNSYEKWSRDKSDELAVRVMLPIFFDHMPKSSKWTRIEQMVQWTKGGRFFILSTAASPEIIEKYISQWLNYQATDHDDYPDATTRMLTYLLRNTYKAPEKTETHQSVVQISDDGAATMSMAAVMKIAGNRQTATPLWGQGGGRA